MSDVAMLLMADAKFMIFNAKPLFRFLLMLFGVFLDQKANERCIIRFDKAKDYSETNKVYLVRIGNSTTLGYRRNRQTLWGGCTDANPKLLLNDT